MLGFDGFGGMEAFADYPQWEEWQQARAARERARPAASPSPDLAKTISPRKKLSYIEARELATIEQRIAESEDQLRLRRAAVEDPAIASDGPRLLDAYAQLTEAQKEVDDLYARWAELESKQ